MRFYEKLKGILLFSLALHTLLFSGVTHSLLIHVRKILNFTKVFNIYKLEIDRHETLC